jgi:ATP-dependent Clp protease ATP-binding subunit ClpA
MPSPLEAIIQRSYQIASHRKHELVTLEHLLSALLEDKDIQQLIVRNNGDLESLKTENTNWLDDARNHVVVKQDQYQPRHTTLLMTVVKKSKTQSIFSGKSDLNPIDLLLAMYGISDSPASYFIDRYAPSKDAILEYISQSTELNNDMLDPSESEEILRTYCVNLNDRARQGKIDPLIGRETEVEAITQILARRNKHNAIMIGDPGVGKTVIVEGLAKRIVENDVPETLADKTIWSIDMSSLVAGTKYRGDFEDRMKQIIKALQSSPDAIAFIDEIHMIMGAGAGGGSNGSMDAANMLKPALSRGDIRCIGSTTQEEYRKYFEKDRALVRRFQKLDINEPSIADSKRILRGIAKYYEEYHGIVYESSALDAAVDLTAKHIHDKFLPDKAIDIIDSAAAWQKIKPADKRLDAITKREIEVEVGRVAKIPVTTVKSSEADKLSRLDKDLKTTVFGQEEAIDRLVDSIYMSRSGLRENDKSLGAFLFTGPSGVGKTEAAKQLAHTLGIEFVRFDMSEYQERHSVSKFIGSPPGYVGYGDGSAGSGMLINTLEKSPHCVLLFDEIEKAHPDVYNIFLQMMDRGMVTGSQGKSASARNAVIIFTSNLGAAAMEKELIGFGNAQTRDEDTKAVNTFFTPEFRNRLDAIIRFNKLSKDNMGRIVDKFLGQLNELSSKKRVNVVVDSAAKDWLIDKGFDPKMGARPLARVIAEHIKKPLSREMLFGKLKDGGAVTVKLLDDKLVFEYMDASDNESVFDIIESDGVDA